MILFLDSGFYQTVCRTAKIWLQLMTGSWLGHLKICQSWCSHSWRRLVLSSQSIRYCSLKWIDSGEVSYLRFVWKVLEWCLSFNYVHFMIMIYSIDARLVLRLPGWSNVSALIRRQLHWLPFPERAQFKLCTLVYKCLHQLAPVYSSELCVPVFTYPADLIYVRLPLVTYLFLRLKQKQLVCMDFSHLVHLHWTSCLPTWRMEHSLWTVSRKDSKLFFLCEVAENFRDGSAIRK